MNPAMNNAPSAAAGALRRRNDSRRRSSPPSPSGTTRLRRAAAAAGAPDTPLVMADLLDEVAERVMVKLRREMRSLELRLTRTVAEVALRQRKEHV